MKQVKLIGLSLLAIFALGAFVASAAMAEEGFLPTQTKANLLGGVSTLEGPGKIVCQKLDESEIKLENDKRGKVLIHWLECKAENLFSVNSLSDNPGIILAAVLLLVCLDPKNAKKELLAEFGVIGLVEGILHLEVPAVTQLIEVKGQALGIIEGANKAKAILFKSKFEGAKGEQVVTDCMEGAAVQLHTLLGSVNKGEFKPSSELVVGGLIQFPAEVEIMDS